MNDTNFFGIGENKSLIIPAPIQTQINEFSNIQNDQISMKNIVMNYQGDRNLFESPGYIISGLINPLDLYNFIGRWVILITGPTIDGPFTANLVNIFQIFQPNTTQPNYPFYTFVAFTWPPIISPGMPAHYPLRPFSELTTWAIYFYNPEYL
ncbi:hypothetical protein K413DRAFT_2573 [Clostridium sp. ASBs410]|jgi:hypothetical protein|nr:hypothetical protein K413DRAFT_2573 [Clostridium sp. ASBs410]